MQTIADVQKFRHKAREGADAPCFGGLWSLTRHPNYLGEIGFQVVGANPNPNPTPTPNQAWRERCEREEAEHQARLRLGASPTPTPTPTPTPNGDQAHLAKLTSAMNHSDKVRARVKARVRGRARVRVRVR